MMRLFLPGTREDATIQWSTLLGSLDELRPDTDLSQVGQNANVEGLQPSQGLLDQTIAGALTDAARGLRLRKLEWLGYRASPNPPDAIEVGGTHYMESDLIVEDLAPGFRVPSFAWDDAGRFAWGSLPYPDSLIIAAEPARFRTFFGARTIDAVSIRPDRDKMPVSAGD